jgi:2-polyprenyl-3-methyl-5-hydroxy-6-metoxy-1,4-benzoquinol methylase
MWDQRYSDEEYAFGTEPNDFLRSVLMLLPDGKALCIGDGEGRNGVWLAEQGLAVTSVDASGVGLEKARALAHQRGVAIATVHMDLADFVIERETWDVIVSIFCHLPPPLRQRVHRAAVAGLRPNGMFVLEAYTPEQIAYGTGGPPTAELTMNLQALHQELAGLKLLHAEELEREVHEGRYHNGHSAVVQLLAIKEGTP